MIVRVFSLVLFLLEARCSIADSDNILSMEMPLSEHDVYEGLEYNSYNETVPPLLSRDFTVLQESIDMIEDGTCKNHWQLILGNLRNLTRWAVKFYDASGKFPDGLLAGSFHQLGNFDECLDIGNNDGAPQNVRGQYCLSDIHIEVPDSYVKVRGSVWEVFKTPKERYEPPNTIHWGICVPASCPPKIVEDGIGRILSVAFSGSLLNFTTTIAPSSCYNSEPPSVDTVDIIYLCVVLFMIAIIVASTLFHAAHLKMKREIPRGTLPQILLVFSLISNVKKLLSPAHDNNLHLDCIAGIKFISMSFIIAGHSLAHTLSGPVLNKGFLRTCLTSVENSIFLNNPLLVDTFLLISAFLFCRILLQELDRRNSVNFFLLYIFRYIRLTPAYAMILAFYVTWLPKLDSGPFWSRMTIERDRCLSSWWTNLLYINNYVNTDKLCMFQSWYLSVDTQLFILAPAVIYPLWKWRRLGEYLLVGVTGICMLIPFAVTLVDHLDPTLMIYAPEISDLATNEYFKNTYIKTHMRAESYCFGLIYGYILYRLQTSKQTLSKKTVRIGWFFGTLSLVLSMYSITLFYGVRKDFTAIESAVYASLHRALWSIGTGWVILACITDNSGPIKNFLNWQFFVPLNRLTYCAYLLNGLIVIHNYATTATPYHLSNYNLISTVLSHEMLTFGGAALLSVTLESPILGVERILLRKEKKTSKTCTEGTTAPNSQSA